MHSWKNQQEGQIGRIYSNKQKSWQGSAVGDMNVINVQFESPGPYAMAIFDLPHCCNNHFVLLIN